VAKSSPEVRSSRAFYAAVTRKSLTDFVNACEDVGPDADELLENTFRRVGEYVRSRAAYYTAPTDGRTAAGYREAVSHDGVVISQGLPATTGEHGEWGSWQMRHALLPALWGEPGRVAGEFWNAADEVCDRFERD
jgi:hypothetical protein